MTPLLDRLINTSFHNVVTNGQVVPFEQLSLRQLFVVAWVQQSYVGVGWHTVARELDDGVLRTPSQTPFMLQQLQLMKATVRFDKSTQQYEAIRRSSLSGEIHRQYGPSALEALIRSRVYTMFPWDRVIISLVPSVTVRVIGQAEHAAPIITDRKYR